MSDGYISVQQARKIVMDDFFRRNPGKKAEYNNRYLLKKAKQLQKQLEKDIKDE